MVITASVMFRVILIKREPSHGSIDYHARILTRRDERWAVCGVITLAETEWHAFTELCEAANVEVLPHEGEHV